MNDETTTEVSGDSGTETIESEEGTVENTEPVFDPTTQSYKVKIDGEEQNWDYETLIRNAQTNASLDAKGKSLAEENRRFQQIIAAAKTNPELILKELGYDPQEWAERKLSQQLDWQKMSPEQQQAEATRQELETMKRQQAQQQEMLKKEEIKQQREYLRNEVQNEVIEVLNQHDLPDDPQLKFRMMADVAKYMYSNRMRSHQQGIEPTITPVEAAKKVMGDYQRDIAHFVSLHNGDKIAELLGPEAAAKYNKAILAQAKAGTAPQPIRDTAGSGIEKPDRPKRNKVTTGDDYVTIHDWQDATRKRLAERAK